MTAAASDDRRVFIPCELPTAALHAPERGRPVCAAGGTTMGTFWNAKLALPPEVSAAAAEAAILSAFAEVISAMSHWQPESEISCYNRAEAGSWLAIGNHFQRVMKRALEIARISAGRFDPTLGLLADLHGCGPSEKRDDGKIPMAAEAHATSGWPSVVLDEASGRLFQPGGVVLDLSAIAKGYAVDLAGESLEALGVSHFLLEIGGEFLGHGCKPGGGPWWIALPGAVENLAALCGGAAATSGNRYKNHLLDPRTGRPAENELVSVSVLAGSCMEADAWATALFIAGRDAGMELAENHGIAAVFCWQENGGISDGITPQAAELAAESAV